MVSGVYSCKITNVRTKLGSPYDAFAEGGQCAYLVDEEHSSSGMLAHLRRVNPRIAREADDTLVRHSDVRFRELELSRDGDLADDERQVFMSIVDDDCPWLTEALRHVKVEVVVERSRYEQVSGFAPMLHRHLRT